MRTHQCSFALSHSRGTCCPLTLTTSWESSSRVSNTIITRWVTPQLTTRGQSSCTLAVYPRSSMCQLPMRLEKEGQSLLSSPSSRSFSFFPIHSLPLSPPFSSTLSSLSLLPHTLPSSPLSPSCPPFLPTQPQNCGGLLCHRNRTVLILCPSNPHHQGTGTIWRVVWEVSVNNSSRNGRTHTQGHPELGCYVTVIIYCLCKLCRCYYRAGKSNETVSLYQIW